MTRSSSRAPATWGSLAWASPGASVQSHSLGRRSSRCQDRLAPARPGPERRPRPGPIDLKRLASVAGRHEVGQADAERLAQAQERGDAGVGRSLLDVHEHPPADARALRELVEREAPGVAARANPLAD